ncbi:MAG TPA: collagen-like protein [Polyangiaceae bacterium]|nr:collagen-like protein [Polyangiaceae bacterium]
MRASILGTWGGWLLVGLLTACSGKVQPGGADGSAGRGELAGAGGGGPGAAGTSGDAGTPGTAGTSGDEDVAGGPGQAGDSGEGGHPFGGSGNSAGAPGNAGSAGTDFYPPIDIGAQQKSDKLDVLFVVDNSGTMADKQNILQASLSKFLTRLANPLCVDAQGKPVVTQPASGDAACITGSREMTPVKDMHLGVITTSIGSHGGSVCAMATTAVDHLDDRAELLPAQRPNLPSYDNAGYLAYDAAGAVGVSDLNHVITDLQTIVSAAGEHGCGYEAPLEAMYRFLVDPEPPVSIKLVNQQSTPDGINSALLAQRNAFLRPDSALAVVIVSDENDCSIRDDGVGWFVGSQSRMPRSTAACASNANDPCCRSCAQNEANPPSGCTAVRDDAVCGVIPAGQSYATWDALHDSLNLRCFNQRQRFGFDLLYPIERYSDALSNPKVRNRSGALVDSPLFAARDGKGPRSATLISVSLIVGAPWQDLATSESLSSGHAVEYLDGAGLESAGRWPLLLGDRALNLPPSDPFMIESIAERTGTNPLTQTGIVPSSSTNPLANAINGHEQKIPGFDDLQYACTFALPTPKACANGEPACDCSADKAGNLDAVKASNSPLCQPPEGGAVTSTQYYGKGYPGARELGFAKLLGARAVPASICPRTLTDTSSPDYAYEPAFDALITRIKATLK